MNKYEILIYWSNEESVFVAKVPALEDCTARGRTQQIALRNANVAAQLWVDTANELGYPVPAPHARQHIFA